MKKCLILILVLGMLMISGIAHASTTIRVGHGLPTTHPLHKGAELFKEIVEQETDGEIKVEIFPANQLGGVREMFENIMVGTLDMGIITTDTPAFLGLPLWNLLESGYIFQSEDHAQKFFSSDLFGNLANRLEAEYGVATVDPAWYYGVRNLTTKATPVKTPEDLQGLKIRVPEAPGYLNTLKGMGASVTPVAFAELYTALQTGIVDGQENPFATIYTYRYYEAQTYLNITEHLISHNTVFMNTNRLDSFDDETKIVILDAIKRAGDYNDELVMMTENDYLEKLKEEGMIVVESDKDMFRERAVKFMKEEWYNEEEAEFYNKIQEIK
jgi:TRAP-type transport system periplasmic protein